jgi:histidinol-phosphatase (PHP family)
LQQNLHTHTTFSDGSDQPGKYIEAAISNGLTSLGFSDHSPLPFENTFALREEETGKYCEAIIDLKEEYKCQMPGAKCQVEVFLGMEADYIPGIGHSFSYFRENYPLDYLIGSVHLVRNGTPDDLWFIDGPDPATYEEGLNRFFGGDIRKGVTAYYRQINEMMSGNKMDIIGHFDKIKMHNRGRFFSETEPWYLSVVDETLDLVRKCGVIVEVNTRGVYKKRSDSLFPGDAILKKIHELKIPVLLSSDAHKPHEVSMLFAETRKTLLGLGFSEIMRLTANGWTTVSL